MAGNKPKLTEVSTRFYELFEPLDSEARRKVVKAVFALLGESTNGLLEESTNGARQDPVKERELDDQEFNMGANAKRWMTKNGITMDMLTEVFHSRDGRVQVVATEVHGNGKQAQSRSCYLLVGIQELLRVDSPTFQDSAAVALCKHFQCYDSPNNSKVRKDMGLSGSKKDGFTLTAPRLREAAELIKRMAPSE